MFDSYRIMTPGEAQEIVLWAQAQPWEQGKARTAEATGTIKKNEELKGGDELEGIGRKFWTHERLIADHAPKRMLLPRLNRYGVGQEYQRHGDAAFMAGTVRTDLACTLFLSHPSTYDGGELCVEDDAGGFQEIKGGAGMCVVYPCHMPHWVRPVTRGERISAITWIESCYRDLEQRSLQRRFLNLLREMEADSDPKLAHWRTTLGTIHGRLQRMWLDHDWKAARKAQ